MKSRIFIIIALIIFCIAYTECRIYQLGKVVSLNLKINGVQNKTNIQQNELIKIMSEIQTTIVNDFYYEGKMK